VGSPTHPPENHTGKNDLRNLATYYYFWQCEEASLNAFTHGAVTVDLCDVTMTYTPTGEN
jgi:hypothetical protein